MPQDVYRMKRQRTFTAEAAERSFVDRIYRINRNGYVLGNLGIQNNLGINSSIP
jgi:hypothetical protein